MVTLTGSLALEAAPHGVRVVAIAPVATVPLGRLNQPDDIARVAVFLASDDAAMITGSCIEVDGGRCI